MGNGITLFRTAAAGALAMAGVAWSKIGWLIVLWCAVMVLDCATGALAAWRTGAWTSKAAHEGLWHKAGMLVIVLVAGLFDVTIRMITSSAGVVLPFEMLVLPVVVSWYILTELGSTLENAVKMGAENVPEWLKRGLAVASDAVDKAGEAVTAGEGGDGDGDGKDDG